jgi:ERCC4-type nuclease
MTPPTPKPPRKRRTKEPLTILVDTREQDPLTEWPEGTVTERATLDTGDYSIKGYETSFTVERKSLDDLVGTMLNAYESNPRKPPKRFNNELWRMQRFDKRALVVTATPQDVMNYKFHCGKDSHGALWHFCCSIEATYNVPVHMIGNRNDVAKWIADLAAHYVYARTKKWHTRAERLAACAAALSF